MKLVIFLGLIILSCGQSSLPTGNSTTEQNLIKNGNFEDGLVHWNSADREIYLTNDGKLTVYSSNCLEYTCAWQTIECEPGKDYKISCDLENDPISRQVGIFAVYGHGNTENNSGVNIQQAEAPQTAEFEYTTRNDSLVQQTSLTIELRVYKRGNTFACQGYFDNVDVSVN